MSGEIRHRVIGINVGAAGFNADVGSSNKLGWAIDEPKGDGQDRGQAIEARQES